MTDLPHDPRPVGTPIDLEPGLRCILAPNPSPMTFTGTNTYIVGTTGLVVIDPGPLSDAHLDAILGAVDAGQRITHIVVTHTHIDHSPLARPLAKATGAPVFAFGGPEDGRSPVMQALAASGLAGGGEGIDADFTPDQVIGDGDMITGDGWTLEVIHTPGHLGNHIALGWGDACFSADHVMGWATSLVSPPDGDLTDFMASCAKLRQRDWRVFYPGHGAAISDPAARLDWLVAHRREREAQVLDALAEGPATAAELAARIYTEVPAALLPAAERNVFAHLIDLNGKSRVSASGSVGISARFFLP